MTDTPTVRQGESTWTRLRRRKVVQWVLVYAGAAWSLLEFTQYLTATYAWPPAISRIATPTLALGALFVLVLAWFHGDKGAQKVSRPEAALFAALFVASCGALWWYVSGLDEDAWEVASDLPTIAHAVPVDAASVGVLPFVNMSSDPEQEFFSDGLSEEILNELAQIPHLYVPARTSSFQFKGKRGDVAAFAAKLGVAAVLEGSVRRAGSRVRVTAQLINAADGFHLWSETYDRDLTDIFAVQTEIARSIAAALKIQLTAEQDLALAQSPPTTNMDAYEAYLLGRYELNKRRPVSIQKSIGHFEKAIALDPQFAVAQAELALALLLAEEYSDEPYPPERQSELEARARALIDRALTLAPDRPEVLAAAGYMESDDVRSLQYFDRSLAANPSNGEVLMWRWKQLLVMGRFDSVAAAASEAVKRDPLSVVSLSNHIHEVLVQQGRRDEAVVAAERLRSLDEPAGQWALAIIAACDGDRPGVVRHSLAGVDAGIAQGAPIAEKEFWNFTWALASLGLREEVLRRERDPQMAQMLLGEWQDALPPLRARYREDEDLGGLLADALYAVGQVDEAAVIYAKFLKTHHLKPWLGPNGLRRLMSAAYAARRAGFAQEAAADRDRASATLVKFEQAGFVTGCGDLSYAWAMLHSYDGREDEAARSLIAAIPIADYWQLAMSDPMLAELIRRPDVQAAMRDQRALRGRQRTEVLQMLCGPNPASKNYQPAPGTCGRMQGKG